MLVVALHILGSVAKFPDSITVRKFSLLTSDGENVLHHHFDKRRLEYASVDRLALNFNAAGKQFEFEFQRQHSIFAPGATIKMTGDVRGHTAQ